MNILRGCEWSGVVRRAFRDRGHSAFSCDLTPSEDGSPYHIQGDMFPVIFKGGPWDFLGLHPPCDHLAVSGSKWFKIKKEDGRQMQGVGFFMDCVSAIYHVGRGYIENPVGIMSTRFRKPGQIIQPYEFGDDASKKTCLWLFNLPKLVLDPARRVNGRMVTMPNGSVVERWANQTDSGQNRLGPSEHRAAMRGRTYEGIGMAMAEQWGDCLSYQASREPELDLRAGESNHGPPSIPQASASHR